MSYVHVDRSNQIRGTLLVLLSAIGYGTEAIFVKFIFRQGFTPVQLTVWRFLLAGLVLLPIFLREIRRRQITRRQHLAMFVVGAFFNAGVVYLLMQALNLASAPLVILCLYVYPIIVSILGIPLLGERMSPGKALGLVLSLAGVALVAWQPGSFALPQGIGFAFGAAVLNAGSILTVKRYLNDVPPAASSSGILLWSMSTYLLLAGSYVAMSPGSSSLWLLLIGLVLIATIMPFWAIYAGLGLIEATQVGIISTSEPVVTAILAGILLGERLTGLQFVGAALIVGAVILINRASAGLAIGAEHAPPDPRKSPT